MVLIKTLPAKDVQMSFIYKLRKHILKAGCSINIIFLAWLMLQPTVS